MEISRAADRCRGPCGPREYVGAPAAPVGRVRSDGELWLARAKREGSLTAGTRVQVEATRLITEADSFQVAGRVLVTLAQPRREPPHHRPVGLPGNGAGELAIHAGELQGADRIGRFQRIGLSMEI